MDCITTYNAFSTKTTITLTLSNLTLAKTMNTMIPYIKGTSEIILCILQPYNIRVVHKPITILQHVLTNAKDRERLHERQDAVHKINCSDCQATCIGETSRNLNIWLTETTQHWLGIGKMHYLQHQLHIVTHTRRLLYELRTKTIKPITTND